MNPTAWEEKIVRWSRRNFGVQSLEKPERVRVKGQRFADLLL